MRREVKSVRTEEIAKWYPIAGDVIEKGVVIREVESLLLPGEGEVVNDWTIRVRCLEMDKHGRWERWVTPTLRHYRSWGTAAKMVLIAEVEKEKEKENGK